MRRTSFVILVGVLPLLLLLKGMMAAPALVVIFLAVVWLSWPHPIRREAYHTLRPSCLLLGAMLALPLASSLWSIAPDLSFGSALSALLTCAMGVLSILYLRPVPASPPHLFSVYAISVALAVALLLTDRFAPVSPLAWGAQHLGGNYPLYIMKNINRGLCALVVLVWPLMFHYSQTGKARLGWALLLALAVAVFQFHSMSAKLGVLAGISTFIGLRYLPVWGARALVVCLPLFLLLFPLLAMLAAPILLSDPYLATHLPASFTQRLQIWQVLLEQFQQRPWFGYGVNSTRFLELSPEALSFIHLDRAPLHPHNPSIQLLNDIGLVGFLMVTAVLTLFLRRWAAQIFPTVHHRSTSGALIVAYAAAGFSSFGIWQIWWISVFWLAMMLWMWAAKAAAEATH